MYCNIGFIGQNSKQLSFMVQALPVRTLPASGRHALRPIRINNITLGMIRLLLQGRLSF